MPSTRELIDQLSAIDQQLHATWLREREAVRRRIVELAVEYQIRPETAAQDIAAGQRRAPAPTDLLRPPRVDLPLRGEGAQRHTAPKYRNPQTGESWSGRGLKPRWLHDAVQASRPNEDFLIEGPAPESVSSVDPLRAFRDAASRTRGVARRPKARGT